VEVRVLSAAPSFGAKQGRGERSEVHGARQSDFPGMSQQTDYRADIDGLRAGAVLLVIGYHFFPSRFPGGYVGVDIFFVISGFLITGILLQDLEHKDFSIARFYGRRIRRIFPALITVLAASLIAGGHYCCPANSSRWV
jgi:peptidoglycan/LPS O-acetylase OafA/YrhL